MERIEEIPMVSYDNVVCSVYPGNLVSGLTASFYCHR